MNIYSVIFSFFPGHIPAVLSAQYNKINKYTRSQPSHRQQIYPGWQTLSANGHLIVPECFA